MNPNELRELAEDALDQLKADVDAEVSRRAYLDNAEAVLRELNQRVLHANGIKPGDDWREPSGAHDAYSEGWTARHKGKLWESLINANVWEPGDPADPQNYRWWRDLSDTPTGDEWDPNGKQYKVHDEVDYAGVRYRCQIPHTSQPDWAPGVAHSLWGVI